MDGPYHRVHPDSATMGGIGCVAGHASLLARRRAQLVGSDMRRVLLLIVVLVAAGAGLVTWMNAVSGGALGGCPAALLEGPLVRSGGTLGVGEAPGTTPVRWAFGYGVERDGEVLVLRHLFSTVAREGDWVLVGGGMPGDEEWFACGSVTRGERTR